MKQRSGAAYGRHLSIGASSWLLLAVVVALQCTTGLVNAAGEHDPCNICGDGFAVGNILAEYNGTSCSQFKQQGEDGELAPDECSDLQNSAIFQACACAAVTGPPTPAPADTTSLTQVPLAGDVVVMLMNVTVPMSPPQREEFEKDMVEFMKEYFATTNSWPGPIVGWNAELKEDIAWFTTDDRRMLGSADRPQGFLRQQRQLQQQNRSIPEFPLVTRTTVTAFSQSTVGIDFESLLKTTIDENEPEFIALQQQSVTSLVNRIYFSNVVVLETFAPDEEIAVPKTRIEDLPPPFIPLDDEDEDDDLDTRTIAGIAAAAGFVFILLAGILCVICRNDDDGKEEEKQSSFGDSLQDRNTRSIGGGSSRSSNASRYRTQRLGNPVSSSTRIVSADGRTVTVLSNSEPTVKPGIPVAEQAPMQEEDDTAYTPVFHDEGQTDGEEEEVIEEYVEEQTVEEEAAEEGQDYYGSQEEEATADEEADQRQDEGSYEEAGSDAAAAAASAGPSSPKYTTREITAPPGKLGIVIETTLDGPVVHKINPNSPLDGVVHEGDLITAIDDVDCRAMSASAITALMVRTSEKYRRMTIRSQE